MRTPRRALLLLFPAAARGLDFDCPFRQLAFEYAAKVLGGRGAANVATALGLSRPGAPTPAPPPAPPARSGWGDPMYCTSCESSPRLRDVGKNAALADCQAACEAEAACAWVNYAAATDRHCVLYAACDHPSHNAPMCGADGHGWWTTYHYERGAVGGPGDVCPTPPSAPAELAAAAPWRRAPGVGAPTAVYVDAAHGSDSAAGTAAAPLRTLRAAQRLVRGIPAAAKAGGVTVTLRGGTYHVGERLEFGPEDGGASGAAPVTWQGAAGEAAVVSGGVPLTGLSWARVPGDAGVWRAAVPAGVRFDQLYAGGRREVRARFPDGDPLVPGSGFSLSGASMGSPDGGDGGAWAQNVDVVARVAGANVTLARGATPDGAPRTVVLSYPHEPRPTLQDYRSHRPNGTSSRFDHTWNTDFWGANTIQGVSGVQGLPSRTWARPDKAVVHMYHPAGWGGWMFQVAARPQQGTLLFQCKQLTDGKLVPCTQQASGVPVVVQGGFQEARGNGGTGKFYVENVREELDQPREWYLDDDAGVLYYMPPGGADPSSTEFVGSAVDNVIDVRGTPTRPVRDLRFDGLTVSHAATTFLAPYEVPSGGDWSIHRGAALFVDGAERVAVTNCHFDQPGGNALMLSNAVVDGDVANNSFTAVGDSAILAVGSTRLFDGTRGEGRMPARNRIVGNLVDTVGVYGKQTAAYFKAICDSNSFENNVIMNGPRSGVNFNDGAAGGERMVGNLVLNFVRESGDHGMFNSWDRQPYLYTDSDSGETRLSPKAHQIHNNFCFNRNYATTRVTHSGYCVDYDDGSSQYNATNNVFLYAGFKIRDGVNRSHDSNLVIDGRLADPQVAGFDSDVLSNNIAVSSNGMFYSCCCSKDAFPKGVRAFGNKFFTPGNTGLPFHASNCGADDGTLAKFQASGTDYERDSTISADVTVDQLLGWAKQRLAM